MEPLTTENSYEIKSLGSCANSTFQRSIFRVQRHPKSQNKLLLIGIEFFLKERFDYSTKGEVQSGTIVIYEATETEIKRLKTHDYTSFAGQGMAKIVLGSSIKNYNPFSIFRPFKLNEKDLVVNHSKREGIQAEMVLTRKVKISQKIGYAEREVENLKSSIGCIPLPQSSILVRSSFLYSTKLVSKNTIKQSCGMGYTLSTLIWGYSEKHSQSGSRLSMRPRFRLELISSKWTQDLRKIYQKNDFMFSNGYTIIFFAGFPQTAQDVINQRIVAFWIIREKAPFFIFTVFDLRRAKVIRRLVLERTDLVDRCMKKRPETTEFPELKNFVYNMNNDSLYFQATWKKAKEIAICFVKNVVTGDPFSKNNINLRTFCQKRFFESAKIEKIQPRLHFMGKDVVLSWTMKKDRKEVYLLDYKDSGQIEQLRYDKLTNSEFEYFLAITGTNHHNSNHISGDVVLLTNDSKGGISQLINTNERRVIHSICPNQKDSKIIFSSFVCLKDYFNLFLYSFNASLDFEREESEEMRKLSLRDLVYPYMIKEVKLVRWMNIERQGGGANPVEKDRRVFIALGLGLGVSKNNKRRKCLLLRTNNQLEIEQKRMLGESTEGFNPRNSRFVDFHVKYIDLLDKLAVVRVSSLDYQKNSILILNSNFETVSTLDLRINPKAKVFCPKNISPPKIMISLCQSQNSKTQRKISLYTIDPLTFDISQDPTLPFGLEGIKMELMEPIYNFIPVSNLVEDQQVQRFTFYDLASQKIKILKYNFTVIRSTISRIMMFPVKKDKFIVYYFKSKHRLSSGFHIADLSKGKISQAIATNVSTDHQYFEPEKALVLEDGRLVFHNNYTFKEIRFRQKQQK